MNILTVENHSEEHFNKASDLASDFHDHKCIFSKSVSEIYQEIQNFKENIHDKFKHVYDDITRVTDHIVSLKELPEGEKRLIRKRSSNLAKYISLFEKKTLNCKDYVSSFLYLENSEKILVGLQNGSIHLLNIINNVTVDYFNGHIESVNSIICVNEYIPNHFLSGSEDHSIILWDLVNKKIIKNFIHQTYVMQLKLYTGTSIFAVGDDEGCISLWNLDNKTSYFKSDEVLGIVTSLEQIPNSYYLLSGHENGELIMWNFCNGDKKRIFEEEHTERINAIVFYKEDLFITCSNDKTIRIWTYNSVKSIFNCKLHNHWIKGLFIDNENDIIITSSYDKDIKIFDLNERSEIFSFKSNSVVCSIQRCDYKDYCFVGFSPERQIKFY